jgi:hypothetical protein
VSGATSSLRRIKATHSRLRARRFISAGTD